MATVRNLTVKVGADLTDAQKKFNSFSKSLAGVGKKFSSVGSTLTKSITAPIVAAGTALGALAIKAGKAADELITMSNQTGISVETLQELKYAARFVDVEVETMAKGLSKVVKAMGESTKAGQDYIEIAGGIQISMTDANGVLKDSETLFYESIDAIGALETETQKEIAAQDLFGKSYQDLMPLIQAGSGALNAYATEARNLGIIITEEDVVAMGAFDDKMESLKAVFEVAGSQIGMAFMPIIEDLVKWVMDKVVPAIQKFSEWIQGVIEKYQELDPQLQNFIKTAGLIVIALGPVFSTVGKVITIFSGLTSTIGILVSPVGIVMVGIAAFAALVFLIYKNWDGITDWFHDLWVTIANDAKTSINNIIRALNLIPGIEIALLKLEYETPGGNRGKTTTSGKLGWEGVTGGSTSNDGTRVSGSFAQGTDFVPETGLAYLHKGEAVIPADLNQQGFSSGSTINIYPQNLTNAQVDYLFEKFNARLGGATA